MFVLVAIDGHSTNAVTQRYIHPEAETIDEIVARGAITMRVKVQERKLARSGKLLTAV
jgi:hypothetical protein